MQKAILIRSNYGWRIARWSFRAFHIVCPVRQFEKGDSLRHSLGWNRQSATQRQPEYRETRQHVTGSTGWDHGDHQRTNEKDVFVFEGSDSVKETEPFPNADCTLRLAKQCYCQ